MIFAVRVIKHKTVTRYKKQEKSLALLEILYPDFIYIMVTKLLGFECYVVVANIKALTFSLRAFAFLMSLHFLSFSICTINNI